MAEMRAIFGKSLEKLLRERDDIYVLDADLSKANGTNFLYEKFPDRCINVGIMEQSMVSVAAGIASRGNTVFVSSFAPFAVRRAFDQIALSVAYTGQSVVIVGTDPGIAAELNGGTHMSFEDIAAMRALAGMTIIEPCDGVELQKAMETISNLKKPVYLRLFRKELPALHDDGYSFDINKIDTIKCGKDIAIFASGLMVTEAVKAANALEKEGISAEVVNVHTIKPLDEDGVIRMLNKTNVAVVCDNHSVHGGLFSAIAELAAEKRPTKILPVGIREKFGDVGSLSYLKSMLCISQDDIIKTVKAAISK